MCLYYNTDTIVCICICMSMLSVFVLKDVLSVKTVEIPSTFSINNVPILILYNPTKPTNISTILDLTTTLINALLVINDTYCLSCYN